jgi:diguanylate cyclase (GGDEF)-like protein
MARHGANLPDLSSIDEQSGALLANAVEAFTSDPMRAATAVILAEELHASVDATAGALRLLERVGILETIRIPGAPGPAFRFRAAGTFLDVIERVAGIWSEGPERSLGAAEHAQVLRARVGALETKNALLSRKVADLSFLCDLSNELGSTLDPAQIAQSVIDAVLAATNGRAKSWFLVVRDGGALTLQGVRGVDSVDVQMFLAIHAEALERSLRTGEVQSPVGACVAVPIPAGAGEPCFGLIVVANAADEGLGAAEFLRLTHLAEIAGRSFANARRYAESIVAGVTDELTGLYNRRYLDRRLGDELRRAQRLGQRVALILLDLDFFKAANDTYGHLEGDRLLRCVAKTIVGAVRDIDIVTRWGGDEFAVIVPGADASGAAAVADRIRDAVEAMHVRTAEGAVLRVTISCGVAWAAPHIHTAAQCVAAADRCLLEAKNVGRNATRTM